MNARQASSTWRLAGRDHLIEELVTVLAAPLPDGGAPGRLLTGSSGVGLTRIARAVGRARVSAGARCLWVTGTEQTSKTLWGAIGHLLPGATSVGDQRDLSGAARAVLGAVGRDGLVILDDVHLLDAATTEVVLGLVAEGGIRVLATGRGTDAPGPLGVLPVIAVPPLPRDAVADVLRAALGGDVDPQTTAALASASGGNPQALADLVTRSLALGTLAPHEQTWQWQGHPVAAGTDIGEWLALVSADVRRVLEVVSVASGTAGPEVVVATTARLRAGPGEAPDDASRAAATAALQDAEALNLVRTVPSGQRRVVALANPQTAQLVREGMGDLAARRAALALAEEVELFGGRRASDVLRAARWRIDATGTAPRSQLLHACDIAARSGDIESLERLAWAVLREAPDPMAAVLLAEALISCGRFAEGAGLLDSAATGADPTAADEEVTARVALSRAHITGMARCLHREAAVDLLDAEAHVTGETWRGALRSARLVHELWRGGPKRAIAAVGDHGNPDAGDGCRSEGDPGAYALTAALAGDTARAERLSAPWARTSTLSGLALSLAAADDGRLEQAAAIADDGYAEAAWAGMAASRMWSALVSGRIAVRRGHPVTASQWYTDAGALAEDCGLPGGARLAEAGRTLAALWFPGPTAAIGEAPTPVDPRSGLLLVAEPVLARAWWLEHTGDHDGALTALDWGYRLAMSRGSLPDAGWIAYGHVRVGRADLAVAGLSPLLGRVSARLLRAWHDHAAAIAAQDAAGLATAGRLLAAAGAWSDAAAAMEAAAWAVGQSDERFEQWFVDATAWRAMCEWVPAAVAPIGEDTSASGCGGRVWR